MPTGKTVKARNPAARHPTRSSPPTEVRRLALCALLLALGTTGTMNGCALAREGIELQSREDGSMSLVDAASPDSSTPRTDAGIPDTGVAVDALAADASDPPRDVGVDSGADSGPLFPTLGEFARASAATVSEGSSLTRYAIDQPRDRAVDSETLRLIEGAGENLLRASESYQSGLGPGNSGPWSNIRPDGPRVAGPDVAATSWCFVLMSGTFGPVQNHIGLVEGTTENPAPTTLSVWSRATPEASGGTSPLRINIADGLSTMKRTVGSEWTRLTHRFDLTGRYDPKLAVEGRANMPVGEPAIAHNVCLWGWQYERSRFPTSYFGPTPDQVAGNSNRRAADIWTFATPPMDLFRVTSRVVVQPEWASSEAPTRAWVWNHESGVGLAFESMGDSVILSLYSDPDTKVAATTMLPAFERDTELRVDFDPNGSIAVSIDGSEPRSAGFNAPTWPGSGGLRIGGAFDRAGAGEEIFGWIGLPKRLGPGL